MNRWLEAIKFDALGQESKQRLTRKEKMNYSLYGACICFALAILLLFFVHDWWGFLIFGVLIGTGARKFQIYLKKRKQWDEENKDYGADQ